MYLYIIKSDKSRYFYLGITNNPKNRKNSHRYFSKNKKSKLYDWMRKYEDWDLITVCGYEDRDQAKEDEIFWILFGRENNWPLLNLADGGEGGFVIQDIEDWKRKLREKRKGRKPFKGMKHSLDTRKYCSKASKDYWDSVETYPKEEIKRLSFQEARDIYGISKTHFYRIKNGN